MAIIAVDPVKPVEFVPEAEKKRKPENQTKFYYLPLLEDEKGEVMVETMASGKKGIGVYLISLTRRKLTGWENFKDSKGKEIEWTEDGYNRIPWDVQLEIGTEILSAAGFDVAKRKN